MKIPKKRLTNLALCGIIILAREITNEIEKQPKQKKIKKMLTKRNKNDIIIISNKGSEKNEVTTKKIKK